MSPSTCTLVPIPRQLRAVYEHAVALPPSTEPIWAHATELTHPQLALPPKVMETEEREDVLRLFVRDMFSPANIWLNLHGPACPIRAITLSDNPIGASYQRPQGRALGSTSAQGALVGLLRRWRVRLLRMCGRNGEREDGLSSQSTEEALVGGEHSLAWRRLGTIHEATRLLGVWIWPP